MVLHQHIVEVLPAVPRVRVTTTTGMTGVWQLAELELSFNKTSSLVMHSRSYVNLWCWTSNSTCYQIAHDCSVELGISRFARFYSSQEPPPSSETQPSKANSHFRIRTGIENRRPAFRSVPAISSQNGRSRLETPRMAKQPGPKPEESRTHFLSQNPRSHIVQKKSPGRSLYEELFPEKREDSQPEDGVEVEDDDFPSVNVEPHLPLKARHLDDRFLRASGEDASRAENHISTSVKRLHPSISTKAVLLIQNASTSLRLSDFQRLVPAGTHISSWKAQDQLLRVIPGRDPTTLKPLPHYYLLFRNMQALSMYRDHIMSIHRLASRFAPTATSATMIPASGLMSWSTIRGEARVDVNQMLKQYALISPSQRLRMQVITPPFSSAIETLLHQGGYGPIAAQQLEQPKREDSRIVLMSFEDFGSGLKLSRRHVRAGLKVDATERGLEWNLSDSGSISSLLQEIEDQRARTSQSSEPGRVSLPSDRRIVYEDSQWFIRLESHEAAVRLVREWNQKKWRIESRLLLRPTARADELILVVNAEILW